MCVQSGLECLGREGGGVYAVVFEISGEPKAGLRLGQEKNLWLGCWSLNIFSFLQNCSIGVLGYGLLNISVFATFLCEVHALVDTKGKHDRGMKHIHRALWWFGPLVCTAHYSLWWLVVASLALTHRKASVAFHWVANHQAVDGDLWELQMISRQRA